MDSEKMSYDYNSEERLEEHSKLKQRHESTLREKKKKSNIGTKNSKKKEILNRTKLVSMSRTEETNASDE